MSDLIPLIQTERLILRAPTLDDLQTLTAFYQTDRSHMVGGPRTPTETFTSLAARIGHWTFKGYGHWHIDSRDTGDFLGWVGVMNPPGWHEPELGWALFTQGEGHGFAYEAVMAARNFVAQHLGLDRLISYIRADNTRSLALAGRLGAVYERDDTVLDTPCQIWRHPAVAKDAQ